MAPLTFVPDPRQQVVLEHVSGALVISGSAGTGKTAVLRERLARRIEAGADPERLALVVGSAVARRDAQAALLARLGRSLPSLRVTTIHGLAYQLVADRFEMLGYREPPTVLDATAQFALVQRLLSEEGAHPDRWPAYAALLPLRGFADQVRQLVLRAEERLLSPDDIEGRAEDRGLSGWAELARFYRTYLDQLHSRGAVDFAGLLARAADAAEGGSPPFDEVIVDDHQDATLAAERLVRAVRAPTLIVAGNLASHVFSFQGASDEPLDRFLADPSLPKVALDRDHRAPDGRRLEAWSAAHTSEEHRAIARELLRVHVEERVPWSDLAVIVRRQSGEVDALVRALDDAGIPREASDPGLSPEAAPATRPYVLALTWLVADPAWRDEYAETILTSELGGLTPAAARSMMRIARSRGLTPSQASELDEGGLSREERVSLAALRGALERAERLRSSAQDAFEALWKGLPCAERLVSEAQTSARARADLDAVCAFAEAAAAATASSEPGVEAFVRSLRSREGGPEPTPASERGRDLVHVLTAHAAVGREFDTVLVAGAVEGNFPSLHRPEPMFDLDILERVVTRSEVNRQRIADERRLFGVVVSRARRRVLLTASHPHGDDSTDGLATRFADELDLKWRTAPVPPFDDPVSVEEAAATWRRRLADPTHDAVTRAAALDGLLALGVDPRRWWFQRGWTVGPPRADTLRLSFSRLDRLENCELQFVLGEELGLEPGGGYQAWVGRLVHSLIEKIEQGELERSPEAFVRAIEQRWQPQRFPSFAISEAERRNAIEVLVPNWFARYGDDALRAEATERYFRFEMDGATLTGKIDRIGPAPEGGRRITDFKSGKADGAGPAVESLQLGIYYLAVAGCDELEEFRPVDGVELAFLAGTKRHPEEIKLLTWPVDPAEEPGYVERIRARVSELIARAHRLFDEGSYTANTQANCFFCGFRTMCSRYPQGMPVLPVARTRETVVS